jgi:hypothetical protein
VAPSHLRFANKAQNTCFASNSIFSALFYSLVERQPLHQVAIGLGLKASQVVSTQGLHNNRAMSRAWKQGLDCIHG